MGATKQGGEEEARRASEVRSQRWLDCADDGWDGGAVDCGRRNDTIEVVGGEGFVFVQGSIV